MRGALVAHADKESCYDAVIQMSSSALLRPRKP
jgi:hypothetical protein